MRETHPTEREEVEQVTIDGVDIPAMEIIPSDETTAEDEEFLIVLAPVGGEMIAGDNPEKAVADIISIPTKGTPEIEAAGDTFRGTITTVHIEHQIPHISIRPESTDE